MGQLNAVDFSFDPTNRYNFWSGLIGGFFLALSYFGTDQSQVGRYLTGRSIAQSRLGLLFNGMVKVPMQFVILFVGAMVFVFYLFVTSPGALQSRWRRSASRSSPHGAEFRALEAEHTRRPPRRARAGPMRVRRGAPRRGRGPRRMRPRRRCATPNRAHQGGAVPRRSQVIQQARPEGSDGSDTNYVFLSFVLRHLPAGVIGLVLAAIFAASMSSTSAELNALSSTTVGRRLQAVPGDGDADPDGRRDGRGVEARATVFWGAFAIGFAEYASRLGSLIEAVNILGSLFYGTILGIFLVAFYCKRVGGTAVFAAALVARGGRGRLLPLHRHLVPLVQRGRLPRGDR